MHMHNMHADEKVKVNLYYSYAKRICMVNYNNAWGKAI